jgi:hypothetical protein
LAFGVNCEHQFNWVGYLVVSINNPKKIITPVILILGVVLFYDTLIDVLLWLIHTIFELIHTLFEIFEQMLDLIIEHLFHTDLHATQISTCSVPLFEK